MRALEMPDVSSIIQEFHELFPANEHLSNEISSSEKYKARSDATVKII